MRTYKLSALIGISALASMIMPTQANAQYYRPGTVVVGPSVRIIAPGIRMRLRGPAVRVANPCVAPPVVVHVVPAPPPAVANPCPTAPAPPAVQPAPPPPPPATAPAPCNPNRYRRPYRTTRAYRYRPPVRRYRRRPARRRQGFITLGAYGEGTLFKDGGMGGAGLYAQLRVSRALHLYTSLGASVSCTTCNKEDGRERSDMKVTAGLQYYFFNRSKIAPFLRGSVVYQHVQFKDTNAETDTPYAKIDQLGGELALGLEWRVTRWFVLSADVAYIGLARMEREGDRLSFAPEAQVVPAGLPKGLPGVNKFDHGAVFRFNAALRF